MESCQEVLCDSSKDKESTHIEIILSGFFCPLYLEDSETRRSVRDGVRKSRMSSKAMLSFVKHFGKTS